MITQEDDGKTVQVSVGDKFEIKLEGNATTGYQWSLLENTLPDSIQILLHQYHPDLPVLAGSGGSHHFTARALKPGTFRLQFEYKRNWEPAPIRNFQVTLSVK
jgi:predicted secreted protein